MSARHRSARARFVLAALLASTLLPASALADEGEDHLEISLGFLAGQRAYDKLPFVRAGGPSELFGGTLPASIVSGASLDEVLVYGLHWDLRVVLSYVRMTLGFDLPFADGGAFGGSRHVTVRGVERDVTLTDVSPYELRFGLGGEIPFDVIVPFVDLIGAVHWVDVELATGEDLVDYEATRFGFSVRAGAKIYLEEPLFVEVAGEAGIVGDTIWSATLAVGFTTE